MTQTGIIRPSITWISYGLSHCNRPFRVLGSEWNWAEVLKVELLFGLYIFLPASHYISSSDSSYNLSLDVCINKEMTMNWGSNQVWVMSQIGWASKTKASLWGIYCNKVLECAKPGLLQDLLMGLMNCMGGDNDKELPTFRADTHLGRSGLFIAPKWILKWISGHSTAKMHFWWRLKMFTAKQNKQAAMCLILCKACSVNGLCEYLKKAFYVLSISWPLKKVNKNLNQCFKITM